MGFIRRIFYALLCLQICSVIEGQVFPTMEEIFVESYESQIQLTDLINNFTVFATEYYSDGSDMGRLDLKVYGNEDSYFYFRLAGDVVKANSTLCHATPIEGSQYAKIPLFHGWLYKVPFIMGPSALLWFSTNEKIRDNMKYMGQKNIRDIPCEWFQMAFEDDRDNVTYNFYFADPNWISPRDLGKILDDGKSKLRIPIRIEVFGISGQYGVQVPVDQDIDYLYFWPIVDDSTKFEPPIGLGCVDRQSEKQLPIISSQFQFAYEIYDLYEAEHSGDKEVDFQRLFYDGDHELARLDKYSKSGFKSELHDFNTGVSYVIKNDVSCKIIPLAHSYFENDGTDLYGGTIETPREVLGLGGNFYYMGKRKYRGIDVEVFESAQADTMYLTEYYNLKVVTVFFTADNEKSTNEASDMVNVPVYMLITLYDQPNHEVGRKQYNIFGYEDTVGPAIYEDFPIQDCFPFSLQKSYFVIIMNDVPEIASQIKESNSIFVEEIKSKIGEVAQVSHLRIPFMKIDYQLQNIFITGLILDRPTALQQFILAFTGHAHTSENLIPIFDAKSAEECAYACVDKGITCGVFHFCGPKAPVSGGCFIDKDPLDKPTDEHLDFDNCYVYFRAELNSNNKEEYLNKALEKLSSSVVKGEFIIPVPFGDNNKVDLKAIDIIIGDGPSNNKDLDKSYKIVFNGFKINPPKDSSALEREWLDTELDCYKACKEDETIDCKSFSYCPESDEKHCILSEEFISEDDLPGEVITPSQVCNVYSLLYLDLYVPNPGKVLMRPGNAVFHGISSAEECAMQCKTSEDIVCRGFEFCESKETCVLHTSHISDVDPSEIVDSKDSKCVHYSAKFTSDYINIGHLNIEDKAHFRKDTDVEECARLCSEDVPTCKAFAYCHKDYKADSTCALTELNLKDMKSSSDDGCSIYLKRDDIHDWGQKQVKVETKPTGYSKGGFAGVVIGTLIFGLIVGVIGFLGYSYYRSRQSNDGMSVRFVKQTNA